MTKKVDLIILDVYFEIADRPFFISAFVTTISFIWLMTLGPWWVSILPPTNVSTAANVVILTYPPAKLFEIKPAAKCDSAVRVFVDIAPI